MAILKGASGSSAELYFELANAANPLAPVLGVDFTLGAYVYAWLPVSGAFAAVSASQIVEKGHGAYAARLTGAQSAQDGTAYVFAMVPGTTQPYRGQVDIVDPTNPARRELPFTVTPLSDPIYDAMGLGLGWPFAAGQVQLRFSTDLAFSNANIANIAERGFNMYAVVLSDTQRANVDASFLAFNASGMVPMINEWDMLTAAYGGGSGPGPSPFVPPFVPPPSMGPIDQVAVGLSRLALQYQTKVA